MKESLLLPSLRWTRLQYLIWDGVIVLVVGGGLSTAFYLAMFSHQDSVLETAFFTLPVLMVLWIPIRISKAVWRLADPDLRAALSVTGISPGRFLWRNLWPHALAGFLPWFTAGVAGSGMVLLYSLSHGLRTNIGFFWFYGLYGGYTFIVCIIMMAAESDHLRRLCSPTGNPGTHLLVLGGWSAGALALPVAIVFLIKGNPVGLTLMLFPTLVAACELAHSRFRRATEVYFRFEQTETDPEKGEQRIQDNNGIPNRSR